MVRYCDHNPGNIKTDLVRYAESWLRTIFVSDRSHSYERSHLLANNSHIIKTELVYIPYNPSWSTNTTLCWNERRSRKFERSGTVQVWPLLCWWETDRGVISCLFYFYPSTLLPFYLLAINISTSVSPDRLCSFKCGDFRFTSTFGFGDDGDKIQWKLINYVSATFSLRSSFSALRKSI